MDRYQCIICNDIKDRVRACASNHFACVRCFDKLPAQGNRCKKCWTTFGAPEDNPIGKKMRQPCVNFPNGCRLMLTGEIRKLHAVECGYRKTCCLGAKLKLWACKWSGLAREISDHVFADHREQLGGRPMLKPSAAFYIPFDMKARQSSVKGIWVFDLMFFGFYVSEPETQRMRIAFFVLADAEVAGRFYLKMQLCDPKDQFNFIKVETNICSDAQSFGKLISESRCITFTYRTLQNFQGSDGSLLFRYLIKRK